MKRAFCFLVCAIALFGVVVADDYDARKAKAAFAFALAFEEADPKNDEKTGGECRNCRGTGKVGDGRVVFKCPKCGGTGKTKTGAAPTATAPAEATEEAPTLGSREDNGDADVEGVFFTASWCGPCVRFHDDEAGKLRVRLWEVDVDSDFGKEFAERRGIVSVPVFQFIDRRLQTLLKQLVGFHTAEQVDAAFLEAKALKRQRAETNQKLVKLAAVKVIEDGRTVRAWGSGTIIFVDDREAWILTAAHNVNDNVPIFVEPIFQRPGSRYRAKVEIRDDAADLAILSIEKRRNDDLVAAADVGSLSECGVEVQISGFPDGGEFVQVSQLVEDPIDQRDGPKMLATSGTGEYGISGGSVSFEGTIVGVVSVRTTQQANQQLWSATGESIQKLRTALRERRKR